MDRKKPGHRGKLTESSMVLRRLLDGGSSEFSDQFTRWKLWATWSQVVGKNVAENSAPVGFKNGTLYVWVKNSAWLHQFHFLKSTLIETINKNLGRDFVRNIFFTIDRKNVPITGAEDLKKAVNSIMPEGDDD